MDQPVKDNLHILHEVDRFHELCVAMIKSATVSFLERDFDRLMVSYGCTGGQHRSVFLGEQLRSSLTQDPEMKENIDVVLEHMERRYWPSKGE